jgi:hypothetical protein
VNKIFLAVLLTIVFDIAMGGTVALTLGSGWPQLTIVVICGMVGGVFCISVIWDHIKRQHG